MTVREAQEQDVCRVCGVSVTVAGQPVGWQHEFGERVYPPPVLVLNFGEEFAHKHCLEGSDAEGRKGVKQQQAGGGETATPGRPG